MVFVLCYSESWHTRRFLVQTTDHKMIPLGAGSESSVGVGLLAIVGTTGLQLLGATYCFSTSHKLKMLIFQVAHSECTV